jgi:hypothetical protein
LFRNVGESYRRTVKCITEPIFGFVDIEDTASKIGSIRTSNQILIFSDQEINGIPPKRKEQLHVYFIVCVFDPPKFSYQITSWRQSDSI